MIVSLFQVGDVVSLRSGGPAMTVASIDQGIECLWFCREKLLRRDVFAASCLRRGSSEFDGVADLVIEGVTHSRSEIDELLQVDCNA